MKHNFHKTYGGTLIGNSVSPLPACLSVVRMTQKEGSAVSGWLLAHIAPSD